LNARFAAEGDHHEVELRVEDAGGRPLTGLRLRLAWPEDGGVDATWTDTWVLDTPTGARWKPDAAASGSIAAMTGLDDAYPADDTQTLTSPSVTVPIGMMRLLSYQRWLTVEDGLYDHAQIYLIHADGAARPLWANPATDGGTTPLLDTGWFTHDIDLGASLSGEESVSFAWSLSSDPGLEYGGWAIDDVSVVELADVPGHYRVDDLRAEKVDGVRTISWSVPWIRPLSGARLVRKVGGWPTGADDGELLESVTDPVWGEVHSVADPLETPGETVYYAVFTSGGPDDWYTDIVEGENGLVLDGMGDLIPHADTGEPPDSAETGGPDTGTPGEGEGEGETGGGKPGGCACASAPVGREGLLALASLLALVGIRRRPRR
jgi:MYXO-CTERM domain-containing protein